MQTIGVVADQTGGPNLNWVTSVGLVLVIAGGTCFWALIHLRGKTAGRLRAEIDLAFEALTDKAFTSLEVLRAHIDDLLPDPDINFDPLDVIVDPSSVAEPAKNSIKLLKERHRLRRQYGWLLTVCSSLKYAVLVSTISIASTTLCYLLLFSDTALWQALLQITAVLVGLSVVLMFVYNALVARIDGVIERSQPARAVVPSR